jgi:aryl-alcohol dehydrogenase-like predicted oxidoreductase
MKMEHADVPGVGKPVSRLVLGTMIVNTNAMEESARLLDDAVELGYTTLDTAHVYGGGNSERAIGQWMADRGNRDQMVILSKGAHHNADRRRVTPFDIAADLHDSLARLRVETIDIYLLHRDDPAVPVGPIVEALNEHQAAGRIRAFGGSNWTHPRIAEANEYAEAHGLVPFAVSSPNFSLAAQLEDPWGGGSVTLSGPENAEARAWYRESRMPVFAWSSLARGLFSGRISRANFDAVKDALDGACRRAYCREENFRRLDRIRVLAEEKGLTVPQVALAWVLNQPLNIFPIVGAASRAELEANLAAVQVDLRAEELAWLNLERELR